jgi:hypothetical protein
LSFSFHYCLNFMIKETNSSTVIRIS